MQTQQLYSIHYMTTQGRNAIVYRIAGFFRSVKFSLQAKKKVYFRFLHVHAPCPLLVHVRCVHY